jgi:hypothetical protein
VGREVKRRREKEMPVIVRYRTELKKKSKALILHNYFGNSRPVTSADWDVTVTTGQCWIQTAIFFSVHLIFGMLGSVSRVRKTNINLRHLFYSSAPDLQLLKQKTLSEVNTHTPLTRTPIRGNETNSELSTSDDEILARRHGE